ncbi:TetR/AcrR family transcriptional regulator [Pseudonocardia nigra]|uniref:TetR/AcrR family transcriptional regulator n=1 Tax=Pseudonocardia nigra TaxID=1921578 RepID=UPI001C5DA339|nr:TetR/AcrR family transcriptional regulator [Pseudonocardia nigra]
MATRNIGRGRSAGRQWGSTEQTRSQLLDAARVVFAQRGFAEASVSDVVDRAGSSVGSLYHHFGGKSELFTALWERYRDEQHDIAASAVADAKDSGVTDPFELFEAGARAYLSATWPNRDLVKLIHDGDTPPGFQRLLRQSGKEWVKSNFRLLGAAENKPVNRVLVALLTSFMGEARREIASARSAKEAKQLSEAMMDVLHRMRAVIEADLFAETPAPTP